MQLILKNILFTLFVPGIAAVYVPVFVFSHQPLGWSYSVLPGAICLVAGGVIYAWCLWDFATLGRGTPAPIDPPRDLVVRGLYRYSRNPMYVGVLCVIAGWALLFQSLILLVYGLIVGLCFHTFVTFYEEPHLIRVFGSAYVDYCANVGRWLPFGRKEVS